MVIKMMDILRDVFLKTVNMSITASYVILFVLFARLLLKKAPKIFSYSLWLAVLFRLIFPFSFSSSFSFFRLFQAKPMSYIPDDINYMPQPEAAAGSLAANDFINQALPAATAAVPAAPSASVSPLQILILIGSLIWISGIAVLALYSVLSYIKVKKKVFDALLFANNIFESENISSPFVLGFVHPKIYLPYGLSVEEKRYIVAHEQVHINRLDYLIKPAAFLVLCLHWFNPLVWISFFMMTKDMEMSCDEHVLKELGTDIKCGYSNSLLELAVRKIKVCANPLAFGESSIKSRVKNVLNYKRPAFIAMLLALAAVIILGILLIANPKGGTLYKNENLGFSLEFPESWNNRYIIKESEDSIYIYSKEVYNSAYGMGRLFTIQRQTGELITEEDIREGPVPIKILLKGNGYTYFSISVTDVQYPSNDKALSNEYLSLSEEIGSVYKSIKLLGNRDPDAQQGFKAAGTSFFTVEIPESWVMEKSPEDRLLSWSLYSSGKEVGNIAMVPYRKQYQESGNLQAEIINEEARRKVIITIYSGYGTQELLDKIKNSFEVARSSNFTIIDLLSNAEEYIARGGNEIFGTIDHVEIQKDGSMDRSMLIYVNLMELIWDNSIPNGYRVENLNKTISFSVQSVSIAPLFPPDYNTYSTYGIYNFDGNFIESHPDYKNSYYRFIVRSDGVLQIIIGYYIP